jgi:hypothetical protein
MRESCALVILWEHKHLSFAREPAESRSVQDAIAIAFEACAKWVCFFGNRTIASTKRASGERGKYIVVTGFTLDAIDDMGAARPGPRVSMSESNAIAIKPMHGLGPRNGARMGFAWIDTF